VGVGGLAVDRSVSHPQEGLGQGMAIGPCDDLSIGARMSVVEGAEKELAAVTQEHGRVRRPDGSSADRT
jgi:hypothetical protein